MTLLVINWSSTGIKILQFILSFSILVVLHELGHFIPARMFKCRVEKFYLFFNPWFSLLKKKIGDTEYGLGWIPFGGYVKISGMIDESMDKEQMKLPPQPWEFRSKPAWQRLIIMVGGVTVNLILGFFIYAMMLWHWGDAYLPVNKMTYGITADSLGQSIGLRSGDKILSIDGEYIDRLIKVSTKIILYGSKTIQVERDGKLLTINIPSDFAGKVIKYKNMGFIGVRIPFLSIDSIAGDTSAAGRAGLRQGDKVLAVNGDSVQFYDEFKRSIQKNKEKEIALTIVRGNDTSLTKLVVPKAGAIGIYPKDPMYLFDVKELKYSFSQAVPAAIKKSYETLESYWLTLKLTFSGKVNTNESLGGVISIGKMFDPVWNWQSFWQLTAFFSLVLALMNILPIPALDGGHALFTLIEIITGRKPSDKFIEYAQMVGMILLLGVIAYALGLDIFRLFK
jgi:regulator of sigma E protease